MLHDLDAHPEKDRSTIQPAQRKTLKKNEELREQMLVEAKKLMGIADDEPFILRKENLTVSLCDEDGNVLPIPGHPDFMIYWKKSKCLFVSDSKFGRILVTPADCNTQIQHYVVSAAENWVVEQAVACITQPWAPGDSSLTWVHYQNAEQIATVKSELLSYLRKSEEPDAPLVGSEGACLYCKAAGLCRVGAEVLAEVALKQANLMSVEEIEAAYPQVLRANRVGEAIIARLIEFGRKGLLKKLRLKDGAETRDVEDPYFAFEMLHEHLASSRELALMVFLRSCSVSVPKLQAELSAAMALSDDDAGRKLAELLGDNLVKNQKRPSIAPNTETKLTFT